MNNPIRAHVMTERTVTFRAWCGTVPIEDCDGLTQAESFEEAIAAALPHSVHKSVVSVLREDAGRNEREVRFYRIKQSTKNGYWRAAYDGGRKVFVGNLEPVLIHALPMLAFEPKPPFRVTRETTHAEIVGIDPNLVEQPQ